MELNLYRFDTFPKPSDWRLIALNVLSVREALMKRHFIKALIDIWYRVYWHGLTLILARITNYIHYKVWDEISYPFHNSTVAPLMFRNG